MNNKFLKALLIILIIYVACLPLSGCTKTTHVFAFGTECQIYSNNISTSKIRELTSYIEKTDSLLSQTELSSDIQKINSAKANDVISIDKITFELLYLSKQLYEFNHSFNPAIYPIVELWGFDPNTYISGVSPKTIPAPSQISETLNYCNFDYFELNSDNLTVTKNISEAKLDLGAIAKGFVCEEVFAKLKQDRNAVVDIGGTLKTNNDIHVHVINPIKDNTSQPFAAKFKLNKGMATATSGDYHRFYFVDDIKYHHIINSEGFPAGLDESNAIISATIIGKNATICDYLSTLIFILGDTENSESLLDEFECSALLFRKNFSYTIIGNIENFILLDTRYVRNN